MVVLRFCPSCGSKLPQEAVIRFCPYCGQNISAFAQIQPEVPVVPAEQPESIPVQVEIRSYADVMRHYDQYVAKLKLQQLEPVEIRRQAAAFFAKLKEQLPARSNAAGKKAMVPKSTNVADDDTYYSIILKSCPDKERLTRRLSDVLCRGLLATRMAVELVPCIIIYKNRAQEVEAVTAIFLDEHAHYTLIKGEFAVDAPSEAAFSGFEAFDPELQSILRNTPAALWLGETVQIVVADAELEQVPGALVATDWGLYIFSRLVPDGRPQWLEIPYAGLAEAVIHSDGNELELIYKEYGREEWLRIADARCLNMLHEHITKALS